MPVLTNPKHELFAQELAKGTGPVEAYVKAGYSKNDGNCSRLKGDERIQARIVELQAQISGKVIQKTAISRAWVLDMLRLNMERALQQQPVLGPEGEEIGQFTYQGSVANRALELIGKEIGLFVDRKEFRMVDEFEKLSDAELVRQLAQTAQLLLTDQSDKDKVDE